MNLHSINNVCLAIISLIAVLISLHTIWQLFTERDRFFNEDLSDKDRTLVWRIVVFLIYPMLTLVDLRSTWLASELAGGYIKSWSYGLLWYHVVPGLNSTELLIPVLFSGALVQCILAFCLIPALFFRPHPLLATLVGYTCTFILALDLIVDPLLSIVGLGSLRWQLAFNAGEHNQKLSLIAIHIILGLLYLVVIRNSRVRLWFFGLTRPREAEQLKASLADLNIFPDSESHNCRVALLYECSGLRTLARQKLKFMRSNFPHSIYTRFLESLVLYNKRDYKKARLSFIRTSDFLGVEGELKASLLGAAACSAFAEGDTISALNLSERALEFDEACLTARMLKADIFLGQGKKDQAGKEILTAINLGLKLDLENKIPLDVNHALELICLTDSNRSKIPVLVKKN